MARSTFSLQKSFLLFIFNPWQKLAEQVILTKLQNYLKSSMISMIKKKKKTRLRLSEPVSVEIEACFTEPDEKI